MKTLFAVVMLIVFGALASFLSVFILNIAGLPGALMAGTPGRRSKRRFVSGSIVSALGQSYVYLAFAAFIVNWTLLAARRSDVAGFLVWPFAFLAVLAPIWMNLIRARVEHTEYKHASAQLEALHLTVLVTLLGFLVFALMPSVMEAGWGWVPYMSK